MTQPATGAAARAERLLAIVSAATDRSTGSAELVARCADRDLRADLDGSAAVILRPLTIRPGARVLEVGAGTGTRTRALLEAGALVTAIEPDALAARVLAARTDGMPGLELVQASPEAWLAGRAPSDAGYASILVTLDDADPTATAAGLLPLLDPHGALVVVARNPWSGARAAADAAAWSVRTVMEDLRRGGATVFRRLAVMPGADAAMAIVTESALMAEGMRQALARVGPFVGRADLEASVAMGAAGLAVDLAPAWLLIAARHEAAADAALAPGVAWLTLQPDATAGWSRTLVLEADEAADAIATDGAGAVGLRLRSTPALAPSAAGPLHMADVGGAIPAGVNGGRRLADALLMDGPMAAGTIALLQGWWAAARPLAEGDGVRRALDLRPARFVIDEAGTWWPLPSGLTVAAAIPVTVLAARGLLLTLAKLVLPVGMPRGVATSSTPADLVEACLGALGLEPDRDVGRIWLELETELEVRLRPTAEPRALVRRRSRPLLATSMGALLGALPAPSLVSLAERTLDAESAVAALRDALAAARDAQAEALAEQDRLRVQMGDLGARWEDQATVAATRAQQDAERIETLESALAGANDRIAALAAAAAGRPRAGGAAAAPASPGAIGSALLTPRAPGLTRSLRARITERADRRRLAASELFDADWYRGVYPDVAGSGLSPERHFLRHGGWEGRDPGPGFSTSAYLARYPDVAASALIPVLHFLRDGRTEGRTIAPSTLRRR